MSLQSWLADRDPMLVGLLLVANVVVALYFVPTAVAVGRGVRRAWLVALINILLGCTAVAWVVALMMAVGPRRAPKP